MYEQWECGFTFLGILGYLGRKWLIRRAHALIANNVASRMNFVVASLFIISTLGTIYSFLVTKPFHFVRTDFHSLCRSAWIFGHSTRTDEFAPLQRLRGRVISVLTTFLLPHAFTRKKKKKKVDGKSTSCYNVVQRDGRRIAAY